jgi:Tol biopolymer transport system component
MSSRPIPGFLRPLALILAALVLPCCNSDVGKGDTVEQITVRVSRGLAGQEPNAPCLNPSISATGRYVVFQSAATNLSPSDINGLVDIFIFDRETGVTTNLTKLPQANSNIYPADCTNPVVSQDGNFVGFISIGSYAPATPNSGPHATRQIYVLNRSTGQFDPKFPAISPWDRDSSELSMSSDGSAVAFVTAANNYYYGYENLNHIPQVYFYSSKYGLKLCSVKAGPNGILGCASGAGIPRISPDGEYVVFSSSSSDLVPSGPTTPQIYLWSRATGTVSLASLDSAGGLASTNAYLPDVSEGARHILFQLLGSVTVPGVSARAAVRRDRVNSITELVTDSPGTIIFTFPSGFPMRISGDGRFIAYRTGDFGTVSGITIYGIRQIRVRDMLGGEFDVSRHFNGTLADADCDSPGISADGRWVVFSTPATTLVDDDFNGLPDIYVRGPLK